MVALPIRLFGCPAISLDEGAWRRQATRAAERLLGYLALNAERLHSRGKLAAVSWKDAAPTRSRNALETTLWRLRLSLEPRPADRGRFLRVGDAGEIGLNFSNALWCDAHAFTTAWRSADKAGLHDVVLALEGELLEGFHNDWIIAEPEFLNTERSQALAHLMSTATGAGAYDAALEYGRRILARDFLREFVHRWMIRIYLRLGQRTQALRQYDTRALSAWIRALDEGGLTKGAAAFPDALPGLP